jgi:hypothetical protein
VTFISIVSGATQRRPNVELDDKEQANGRLLTFPKARQATQPTWQPPPPAGDTTMAPKSITLAPQSSPSPSSERAVMLAAGFVPAAPRLPRDAELLASCDPMSETLRAMGGQRRVDAARAHAIRVLIASALRGE